MKQIILFLAVLFSVQSFASGREGHGGIAQVCTIEDGTQRIDILDLVDGREKLKLSYQESRLDVDSIIATALRKLEANPKHTIVLREINKALQWIKDPRNQIKTNLEQYLVDPLDYHLPVIQNKSCTYKAIGYFGQDMRLRIDSDLFVQLSPFKIATFLLHEAAGIVARSLTGAKFTDETRLFVAILMSSTSSSYLTLDESFRRTFLRNYIEEQKANHFLINVQYPLPRSKKYRTYFKKDVVNNLTLELSTLESSGEIGTYSYQFVRRRGLQAEKPTLGAQSDLFRVFENEVHSSLILSKDFGDSVPITYLRRAWINSSSGKFKYKILLDGKVIQESTMAYVNTTDRNGKINPWFTIDIVSPGTIFERVQKDDLFVPYPSITIE